MEESETKCKFSLAGGSHWHSLDGKFTLHFSRQDSTLKLTNHHTKAYKYEPQSTTLQCLQAKETTGFSSVFITRVIHGW